MIFFSRVVFRVNILWGASASGVSSIYNKPTIYNDEFSWIFYDGL